MNYKGVILKSRTLDVAALSVVMDAVSLAFLAYHPEQLGITLPAYAGLRMAVTSLQAYLRFKTTGPVGDK